jgi:hypothetical protein
MITYVITIPDESEETCDPGSAWDTFAMLFNSLRGDCVYKASADPYTGDATVHHHRTGITVRRLQ